MPSFLTVLLSAGRRSIVRISREERKEKMCGEEKKRSLFLRFSLSLSLSATTTEKAAEKRFEQSHIS